MRKKGSDYYRCALLSCFKMINAIPSDYVNQSVIGYDEPVISSMIVIYFWTYKDGRETENFVQMKLCCVDGEKEEKLWFH